MKSFSEWLLEAIMDPKRALEIFGLAEFPKTAAELRQLHKQLALANHPDRGGSLDKMKDINAANDVLKQWVGKSVRSVSGASSGAGSMRGNAKAYRQAGDIFNMSRERAEANRAAAAKQRMKDYGPIFEAILQCLKKIDFFGCVNYLTEVFGEPFTHIEKAATVQDVLKMKDRTKQSWVSHLFVNKSRTIVFEVELIGDSDHMTWLMRHKPDGFDNSKNFDFEWSLGVNYYTGANAQKKVLSRRAKYRRSDLTLLRDPAKLFPKAKLAKLRK